MNLTEKFGLDEEERQRRLEFLDLREEDAEKLRGIHEVAEKHADTIIDRLYDHILRFEPTRAFFQDPKVLERVKSYQKRYFIELTAGRTDEAYFEDRLRVGDTHQRIELLPQWYLGLYSRYFQIILEQLTEHFGPEKAVEVIPSLTKQMFLDIGLAMDAYIQGGFIDKLRSERRVLADLREELARKEKLAILGQLAGGVGHELRNPMAAMQASIYFLKMAIPADNPKIQRHLQLLDQELNSANEIITNLLDFSRVKEPELARVSAAELVRDVLERYDWRTVQLVTELEEIQFMADAGQVKQIVGNLVTNAVQAMPEGGTLTVQTKQTDRTVTIAITDTGAGVAEDILEKIFQPLFTTKAKGIGLGLAVCDSLVRANRGRIRVISEVGKGSTFTLEFPAELQ
jgi:signal transduction histidine kinase